MKLQTAINITFGVAIVAILLMGILMSISSVRGEKEVDESRKRLIEAQKRLDNFNP